MCTILTTCMDDKYMYGLTRIDNDDDDDSGNHTTCVVKVMQENHTTTVMGNAQQGTYTVHAQSVHIIVFLFFCL